jgi:hypothetical protein
MSNLISKTIPIPDRKRSTTKNWKKYPVYKLKEVGESIKIKDLGLKSVSHSKEYILAYSIATRLLSRQIIRYGLTGKYKIGVHATKKKKELRIWKIK